MRDIQEINDGHSTATMPTEFTRADLTNPSGPRFFLAHSSAHGVRVDQLASAGSMRRYRDLTVAVTAPALH